MEAKTKIQPITVPVRGATKRSKSSEQHLVSSHTVGNWINTYSSIDNIKRDEKYMPELSESHTNPNLGVTMRGKGIIFLDVKDDY